MSILIKHTACISLCLFLTCFLLISLAKEANAQDSSDHELSNLLPQKTDEKKQIEEQSGEQNGEKNEEKGEEKSEEKSEESPTISEDDKPKNAETIPDTGDKQKNKKDSKRNKRKEAKKDKKKPVPKEYHEKIEPADKELPPLRSMITAPFGERRLGGPTGIRTHAGIDIRAHLGWAVVAFKSGQVTKAGFYGGAGIMVEITQDDGFISSYAHLQTAVVTVGQRIEAGEKLGEVGCTGHTTGAHLHFVLTSPKGHVDPMRHLARAEDILRPSAREIPDKLGPQQCNGHIGPYSPAQGNFRGRNGPVIRGRNGRPTRLDWNALRNYKAPEIPQWSSRRGLR